MAWPVLHLPVIQRWDCHSCGQCCKEYHIFIASEEKLRIERQGWENDPALTDTPLFVQSGTWSRPQYRLNQRPDGSCVFLDPSGKCRIHGRFGLTAKPLACQIFPFVLVPAGDHWRVGLRFACPSVAKNHGPALATHLPELRRFGRDLEIREGVSARDLGQPTLQSRQSVDWRDLDRFNDAMIRLVGDTGRPLELRLRRCLGLTAVCRTARFDQVQGRKLDEFLSLLIDALDGEVVADPAAVPAPTWIGRVLFRQAAAVYCRRDFGPRQGVSRLGRLALLAAAWRFARGSGVVPPVHGLMPHVTFEEMESPAGPLPVPAEEILARYYTVKLHSLQFFGPANFSLSYWDGIASLLLTFPVILWLTRAFRARPREDAVAQAVQIVDDNFGYNRLFGLARQKFGLRILASRGELARLIAWYGR